MTLLNPDPNFPDRPQDPEFLVLSEVICAADEELDVCETDEEREAAFLRVLSEIIPAEVLSYMATQRALRAVLGTAALGLPIELVVTSGWIDGFVAGARYAERKHSDEG